MARYFFHRIDGGFDPDTDGTECDDLQVARLEALSYAAGLLRDHPEFVWADREMRIAVVDEWDHLLFTILIRVIETERDRMIARDDVTTEAG